MTRNRDSPRRYRAKTGESGPIPSLVGSGLPIRHSVAWHYVRGIDMKSRMTLAVVAFALMMAACGGGSDGGAAAGDSAAAQAAIQEMVADGVPQETAECFVGNLVDEFGVDEFVALQEESEPSPAVAFRALELLDECGFGFGDIDTGLDDEASDPGAIPSDFRELVMPRDAVDGPYTFGDDDDLDALWSACEAGSGSACDDLFFQSAFGSEYEAFGNTCGNRMELNLSCFSLDQ